MSEDTPDKLDAETVDAIRSYLRPERALSPKSAAAIEEVLGDAYEELEKRRSEGGDE